MIQREIERIIRIMIGRWGMIREMRRNKLMRELGYNKDNNRNIIMGKSSRNINNNINSNSKINKIYSINTTNNNSMNSNNYTSTNQLYKSTS